MKKVFLIGKFNEEFEEMNKYLANHFSVQVCVDNLSVMHSVLKLSHPDFFVLNTFDMEDKNTFIDEIKNNYSDIPLISIETSQEKVGSGAFDDLSKFRALVMPVDNGKLVQAMCNMLGLEYDSDNKIIIERESVRKTILAIDDNAFQLRMLNELLKDTYDVELATSAMKAMAMLGRKIPDLILLDYEMPICDGKMALQMIRELDEVKDVPVIFLTGVKDAAHINAVLSLQPAGYILKPAKSEVLLEEIAKHIR
jgi:CheY-like chemotaxis protein